MLRGLSLRVYGIELSAVRARLDEPDTLALVLEAVLFPAALRALFTRHEFSVCWVSRFLTSMSFPVILTS